MSNEFDKSSKLPPVIEDFLKERNLFPKGRFTFFELRPTIYQMMTTVGKHSDVSYFKIEEFGRLGHIIIENQDGDLKVIRNSLC